MTLVEDDDRIFEIQSHIIEQVVVRTEDDVRCFGRRELRCVIWTSELPFTRSGQIFDVNDSGFLSFQVWIQSQGQQWFDNVFVISRTSTVPSGSIRWSVVLTLALPPFLTTGHILQTQRSTATDIRLDTILISAGQTGSDQTVLTVSSAFQLLHTLSQLFVCSGRVNHSELLFRFICLNRFICAWLRGWFSHVERICRTGSLFPLLYFLVRKPGQWGTEQGQCLSCTGRWFQQSIFTLKVTGERIESLIRSGVCVLTFWQHCITCFMYSICIPYGVNGNLTVRPSIWTSGPLATVSETITTSSSAIVSGQKRVRVVNRGVKSANW